MLPCVGQTRVMETLCRTNPGRRVLQPSEHHQPSPDRVLSLRHALGQRVRGKPQSGGGPCPPTPSAAACAARAHHPSRGARRQGVQVTCTPFVRLKVLAVQNAAALRYHTW